MSNITYLLFLGSGRTGSTLVGQLLNCHPNVLITNESRVLHRAVASRTKLSDHLSALMEVAHQELQKGTRQYDSPGKAAHTRRWQRDWVNLSEVSKPEKGTIKYIGDKKQGGNTALLLENEEAVLDCIDFEYIPITVIRDPHQILASYIRLNDDAEESCKIVIRDTIAGYDFTKKKDGIITRYEELLNSPEAWCRSITSRLQIECDESWTTLVKSSVNSEKQGYELSDDVGRYFRSQARYSEMMTKMGDSEL